MSLEQLTAVLADRYTIVRELGHGGMATVYLARDIKHDREVAIKVFRPELSSELGAKRFLHEIKITARLEHPHILTLIDSGVADGALYYVVPVVRGESLRERLTKEGQLPLEDALRIVTQVASALDYAHGHGVIHRDIKPENILLQEGEAILSDFGIAFLIAAAGGQRMTETGLAVGTPQYMSPEQAMGDRLLDARSDVYSLAAVLYEMLAGDPPHMGSTVQAVIAKLVTSQPTKLRSLRATVPKGVDEAVMKALAKAPADRYASAGNFASALAAGAAGRRPVRARSMARRIGLGALALAALAAVAAIGVWAAKSGRLGARPTGVILRDHTQLTSTGLVEVSAISADGKQLAYSVRTCDAQSCPRAIEIAEADGSAPRRILDSVSADQLHWSPDGRHLILGGVIAGREGDYLLTPAGGAPLFVNAGAGSSAFFADGDSLLLPVQPGPHDSVAWIRVAALDGLPRDSMRLVSPGEGFFVRAMPRTPWILVGVSRKLLWELRVVDRQGREVDRQTVSATGDIAASADAVWWGDGASPQLVRLGFNARSGKLDDVADTVLSGQVFSHLDLTADGRTLIVGDLISTRDVYAIELRDLVRGRFPPGTLLMHSATATIEVEISPDGRRLLVGPTNLLSWRTAAGHVYTIPFGGGAESPIPTRGIVTGMGWADSLTVFLMERDPGKTRFVLVDAHTGSRRGELSVGDSVPAPFGGRAFTPLFGGGWAWISADGRRIMVQRQGDAVPRAIPKPLWYGGLSSLTSLPVDGRLAFVGFPPAGDSSRLSVAPLTGGDPVAWLTMPANSAGYLQPLADGSILFQTYVGDAGRTLLRVRGPGRSENLGHFAPAGGHPWYLTVSADAKRAAVVRGYNHADVWSWRVSPR